MTFSQIVLNIVMVVNAGVIPLMYALAIIFIFIGIVRYFFIESGEEAQEKGRKTVLYGIIGIVVIFSVWGIVNILLNTLDSFAGTTTTSTTSSAPTS